MKHNKHFFFVYFFFFFFTSSPLFLSRRVSSLSSLASSRLALSSTLSSALWSSSRTTSCRWFFGGGPGSSTPDTLPGSAWLSGSDHWIRGCWRGHGRVLSPGWGNEAWRLYRWPTTYCLIHADSVPLPVGGLLSSCTHCNIILVAYNQVPSKNIYKSFTICLLLMMMTI